MIETSLLRERRVIVTGAAGGMGRAIVRSLLRAGATVVALDLKEDDLRRDLASVGAKHEDRLQIDGVDLISREKVFSVFGLHIAAMGGVDALVHTGGIFMSAPPETIDMADYDRVMDINLRGTILANQAVFEAMKHNGGGSIINFGSSSGHGPESMACLYSASKGAVHSWTRSLAHAWGQYGIRANAILPIIETPMYHTARANMTEEQRQRVDERNRYLIPLGGRFGDAERDLAPVVEFLIGDGSRFVTGQLIPVDGGMASVR